MKKKTKANPTKGLVLGTSIEVQIPVGKVSEAKGLRCSSELEKFRNDFQKTLDLVKNDKKVSKDDVKLFENLFNVFDATTAVMKIVEAMPIEVKKPACKKPCKSEAKPAAKKKPCCGFLSEEEKRKIKALRKSGMSIKAIGKGIKRGEKVVSDFVHSLEKAAKRK